jgi:recombination protein RecR
MYEGVIQDLIDELGQLPGVGPKGAQRIAFHLVTTDPEDVRRLASALIEVVERVKFCRTCGNVAQEEECRICRDPRRDLAVICVVEEPKDVAAIEKIREFRGRYHVLGGAISPIDGIGPDELRISQLMTRLTDGTVTELILATDPNLEGEATAAYLARLVKPMGLRVTRPASGLPVGGELEYADEVTLADRIARHAQDFLDGVTALANGEGKDQMVPLLLLEVAQILLAGAQLGASQDIIPAGNWEPDVGADPDLDALRTGLAGRLRDCDEYAELFDPYQDTTATPFRLSDDLAAVSADLIHGLQHYQAGRVAEALWWWQYSYVNHWGTHGGAALRALHAVVAHARLDVSEEPASG